MVSVSEKLKQQKDQYSARGKYVWIATRTVKLKRLAYSQENQESRPQSICFGIKLTSEISVRQIFQLCRFQQSYNLVTEQFFASAPRNTRKARRLYGNRLLADAVIVVLQI